jgi:ubiquinone/menaquinone biosynthesis C-methylase UbiE
MNFGFHEDGLVLPLPPERERERYSIQLYHHLASAVPIADRDVLEVGCGRGGGAAWIHETFRPSSTTAVDYVPENVELAQRRYTLPNLHYQIGDAEMLPFADQSFDVVLNLESSHCYGNVPTFIDRVRALLRPGGFFLIADFRPAEEMPVLENTFEEAAFRAVRREDITARVVAALDLAAPALAALVDQTDDEAVRNRFAEFAALPGSDNYRRFKERRWLYGSWVLTPLD